jgi:adenine-specific DNA-methyltransferase
VAEQWGRRWITVDTSRVALTLARTRLMSARYPYYLLADSEEGRARQAELLGEGAIDHSAPPSSDVRQGFVYRRVPHVQLRDIANNEEIDAIWERWQERLEPLRSALNDALGESWEEWEVPREAGKGWPAAALAAHSEWWECRRERQREIDESIARNSESEVLYDQPEPDNKKVRVAGPFTVESLSPHRVLDPAQELPAAERDAQDDPEQPGWESLVIDQLKSAGIQNTKRAERLRFTRLERHADAWLHAEGEFEQDGETKTIALSIGPQWGTVGSDWVREAAKEAMRGRGFDVLAICALAFDGNASEAAEEFEPELKADGDGAFAIAEEERQYGRLPVLLVRVNPDLAMGDELLKKTGSGNLFMVFGEPDINIDRVEGEDGTPQLVVRIHGVDVYDPTTGVVRSSSTDDIACWFIDTAYDEESFFVRHAYFTGADEPYQRLQRALRAEIDEEAWESLYRTESRPFPVPESGKVAVKVINHYGDEVLKVYEV